MQLFFDPVSASLASWTLWGRSVEHQMRFSVALMRGFGGIGAALPTSAKPKSKARKTRAAKSVPVQTTRPNTPLHDAVSPPTPKAAPARRKRKPSPPPPMPK